MVERITNPHRPVSLRHGTGRLPDGQIVKQPPTPPGPPVTRRQYAYGWAVAGLVLALVLIGVLT